MTGPVLAEPTPAEVIIIAAELFGVEADALTGYDQHMPLARYRKLTMAACRQVTSCSYPVLGKVFGGRNYTSIRHACVSVGEDLSALGVVERVVDEVRARRRS